MRPNGEPTGLIPSCLGGLRGLVFLTASVVSGIGPIRHLEVRLRACTSFIISVYSDWKEARTMISREKIIEEIERVPDKYLDELYEVIRGFEVKKENRDSEQSVMARLRQIKISALPDFSIKANLYSLEDENAK